MSFRVLIVPDKYKGTLTAQEAAKAIARGWTMARPQDQLDILPMSDGGDGFGEVIGGLLKATAQPVNTIDAAHRSIHSAWWWNAGGKTAIIESARVIGLAMLPSTRFHPFQLDTFGLGNVLQAAQNKGAKHCIIGIGGSATNDGGFGLARALGWRFFSKSGEIEQWWQLHELARLERPKKPLTTRVTVAVDVKNKLLGAGGCSRVYGPQKGLRPEDLPLTEKCLGQLARVVKQEFGFDHARTPGAGAAGGLGFGLLTFAGAACQSGFDIFSEYSNLEERIAQSDLVITGEGAIDDQTYMGKGVGRIARLCKQHKVPCLGLAGRVINPARARKFFTRTDALIDAE